ncbi:alkene reductase [Streptomyces hainanensis]|uniref:Alkene reductase n=1 Tax=Streptomyces hainanensis TaxID=402648 RepID=A0A4R4TU61_9ACTN|nr:alkene reductase [Streptomyces hainanensis]TDC79524.1 alkene reductase [Streptomyces hainanensis]
MTSLLDGYRIGELRLPNRVVMAPMTRARATADGLATPSMATYYARRATAGLIVSEGVAPNHQGQSNPRTPGLRTEAEVASWRPVTAAVHANGGRIFAQLMHGGRVGHVSVAGHRPVAPSAVTLPADVFTPDGMRPASAPRALATAEVAVEAAAYGAAARRAVDAGFDGVELHGANGYLIQQFLSSNANLRTDRYGGTVAGRLRFAVEAVEACVDAIGAARVGIRLSPGGRVWDMVEDDAPGLYAALFEALAPLGLAYVHLLAPEGDDELLPALRKAWPGTLIVNPGGQIGPRETDLAAGERWLAAGADLIGFGRAFLANPDLVERFRTGAPLRPTPDRASWYSGGDAGYLDHPGPQH